MIVDELESMYRAVVCASEKLLGKANKTPIMSSHTLNEMFDAQIYFKCENFQKIGAFKFRGAYNAISSLSASEQARGILTYSSGNHGQAIAKVTQMLGIKSTIIMPNNAPVIKHQATSGYGANIIEYDPKTQSREQITKTLQIENGYTFIPPFDHLDVIAGQGTAALEMFEELGELDSLLVPCGGGGLLSGSAVSAKHKSPNCHVIGIEPELADDACRSFYTKQLQTVENPATIADGTRTASLGVLTFPLILNHVDAMKSVSEMHIIEAVKFLFYRMKLVIEPSGALGLAALLNQSVKAKGRIGIILSGGNIDAQTMTSILNSANNSIN